MGWHFPAPLNYVAGVNLGGGGAVQ
jgi:hypothetical protein